MGTVKRGLLVAGLMLALCVVELTAPLAAQAQGEPEVLVYPPEVLVGAGQTSTVEVQVHGVTGLYGLDIRLTFDPTIVQVVDSDPGRSGVQVRPGELLKPDFLIRNTADNVQGTVWFAVTQLNPTSEVTGGGVAFAVIFQGVEVGDASPLQITYSKLAGRGGETIPSITTDGSIAVVPAAQAPATPTSTPPPLAPTAVTPAGQAQPTSGSGGQVSTPAPTQWGATSPLATATQRPGVAGQLTTVPAGEQVAYSNQLSVPMMLAGMAGVLVVAGILLAIWLVRARTI